MIHTYLSSAEIAQVQDFVLAERGKSLSEREWHFRLRGYGYGLRESEGSWMVTTLLENADLFEIDKATVDGPISE
ncbi:hypothetical protein [Ruegeria arenilitoris]|uniref:hypothetical protein n=1 Tax=Ruegeria arenilitoris TaxID=1173585 RepID=UPI00147FA155|nr:hypothetical protein [Ruegeria arenilitoris]